MNDYNNQDLMIMLFDTLTGNLLRSKQTNSWNDGTIYSQSMVFDQSNYVGASLSVGDNWYMFRVLLADVSSVAKTDWVISTNDVDRDYDWARGYSIIFNHNTSPTGYFTSGSLSIGNNLDDKGFLFYHILNDGTIQWEGRPDGDIDYKIKYLSLSPDNLILWGCGIGSSGTNDRA